MQDDAAGTTESARSVTRVSPKRRKLVTDSMRQLLDGLTAQQASLVRLVALVDSDYLNHSYYLESETGKRIAYELEPLELDMFIASWGVAPLECIRSINEAILHIDSPSRRERYVQAAVDLEIIMDQHNWTNDGKVYQGIPDYLMHGYTDMGSQASPTERSGREKIKVDKQSMLERLVESRRRSVTPTKDPEALVGWNYNAVRRDIEFNELGVEELSRDFGNESIVLSEYLEKGLGVCRHLSIFFQLYLQEAGIDCRVVKGNLKFYIFKGRHAWNLARLQNRVYLIDVTHPNVNQPFIVSGSSEQEVYQRAANTRASTMRRRTSKTTTR